MDQLGTDEQLKSVRHTMWWCTGILRLSCTRGSPLQWQHHGERRPFANSARHVDAALMIFDDATGERESQACSVAFGRVEGAEDVGKVLGSDTPAVVFHFDHGG